MTAFPIEHQSPGCRNPGWYASGQDGDTAFASVLEKPRKPLQPKNRAAVCQLGGGDFLRVRPHRHPRDLRNVEVSAFFMHLAVRRQYESSLSGAVVGVARHSCPESARIG
ncbi:hypothetical protein N8I74_09735 [Chitiniphilus purpureus]|uniref:Uncharacterized protein n=1 Tax=Chitiniphilus purpureus TaxID=2981137 RepID=A0ABY6DHA2_9NEIS|nr:hypothetical protein [Chitiniphilus sp. CD1]UXY13608.1 hypothetical protein N8I74_09735 [Chitiniphilus sp. CD1]